MCVYSFFYSCHFLFLPYLPIDLNILLRSALVSVVDFLNPLYIREGKSQIVFAIGCTGGNHRSVAFAEALKDYFSKKWDNVTVSHRDIDRK